MKTMTRIARGTALALSGGLMFLAAQAGAQQFTFGVDKIVAAPGSTVDVPIFVQGATVPVAGANFTVRIRTADEAAIRLSQATSFANPGLTAFSYVANGALTRTNVQNGILRGNVNEYRGVVYSTNSPAATFSANNPFQIATLMIPVTSLASGNYQLELVSAIDNETGLLGVSNASGVSLVPVGASRPAGDMVTIVVDELRTGVDIDVVEEGAPPTGWSFKAEIPSEVADQPEGFFDNEKGMAIRPTQDGNYGFWAFDNTTGNSWRYPNAGKIYVTDWDISSDTTGVDTPPFRLRTSTANFFLSSETQIQDANFFPGDTMSVVPGLAGKTYRTLSPVPSYAADNYSIDGMNIWFDLLQFGLGTPGKTIYLGGLSERAVDAPTGGTVVYDRSFDFDNTHGWVKGLYDQGGIRVGYTRTSNGLGVRSGGPLELVPGTTDQYRFSYGYWYTPEGVLGVTADATKWYKVEAEIRGNAADPVYNPAGRMRFYTDNFEYFQMVQMLPFVDPADFNTPRPTLAGTTLTGWFQVPADVDARSLSVAFDMYHLSAPGDGTDIKPTLYLKNLKITAYNDPLM